MEKILVVASERFGDNICCAGAICQIKNAEIIVATTKKFGDALLNIPNVKKVLYMNYTEADAYARDNGYRIIQLTLSSIPRYIHRLDARLSKHLQRFGFDYIKPMPAFFPTKEEINWANYFAIKHNDKPLLGVEASYGSNQGYLKQNHLDAIVGKYSKEYNILWLCPDNYPTRKDLIIDLGKVNRRYVCTIISKLSLFLSSFSGYYWVSRSLENPPKTVCFAEDQYKEWTELTNVEFVGFIKFNDWLYKND
jgi:hypothetical protein